MITEHAIFQVMPSLSDEDFASLKADIEERGVLVPVEYDEAGNILDGHHRIRACQELGILEWPKLIREGMTDDEKRVHARQLNLARRHLNQAQKRELIAAQLMETPEKSDRQIAVGLGVSHPTVSAVRNELEKNGDVENFTTSTDTKGRKQPRSKPKKVKYVDNTPAGKAGSNALWHWMHCKPSQSNAAGATRIHDFRKIRASADQLNDTWGHLVPLQVLHHEVGVHLFNPLSLQAGAA